MCLQICVHSAASWSGTWGVMRPFAAFVNITVFTCVSYSFQMKYVFAVNSHLTSSLKETLNALLFNYLFILFNGLTAQS